MKKSIGDNMFPRGVPFEHGLEVTRRSGYDGIELWLGTSPWFNMRSTDAQLRELKRKIDSAGLAVSDVANDLDWEENICARDPAKRDAAFRHIERQIEAAQIFGCKSILVVAGVVTPDLPYNEVYNRCRDGLRQLGDTAAKAGIRVGVENCNSEQRFLLSPREFDVFLKDVGSPAVGLHLDVGNIHDTGFPEQWIEMHGPNITCVHLKDVLRHRGRCGNQSVYTNLFLGDNDWKAIRAAFEKVRYDGWLVAEMELRNRFAWDQQFVDTNAAMTRLIEGRL